jgi:hypothetical protein
MPILKQSEALVTRLSEVSDRETHKADKLEETCEGMI